MNTIHFNIRLHFNEAGKNGLERRTKMIIGPNLGAEAALNRNVTLLNREVAANMWRDSLMRSATRNQRSGGLVRLQMAGNRTDMNSFTRKNIFHQSSKGSFGHFHP